MSSNSPVRLSVYLSKVVPAHSLDYIREQSELLTAIRRALPHGVGVECRAILVKGSELRITVDSSSQASILRFHQTLLVEKLNTAGYPQIKMIRIKLSTIDLPGNAAIRGQRIPNRNTVKVIATAAAACQEPDIRDALTKLANTLEGLHGSARVSGPDASPLKVRPKDGTR